MLRPACSIFKPALHTSAWPKTFSTQHAALSKGKLQFYAVRRGRTTGVFPSWEAAKAEVSGPSVLRDNLHNQADDDQAGFSNAQYQGFADRESAEAYVKGDVFKGMRDTSIKQVNLTMKTQGLYRRPNSSSRSVTAVLVRCTLCRVDAHLMRVMQVTTLLVSAYTGVKSLVWTTSQNACLALRRAAERSYT